MCHDGGIRRQLWDTAGFPRLPVLPRLRDAFALSTLSTPLCHIRHDKHAEVCRDSRRFDARDIGRAADNDIEGIGYRGGSEGAREFIDIRVIIATCRRRRRSGRQTFLPRRRYRCQQR